MNTPLHHANLLISNGGCTEASLLAGEAVRRWAGRVETDPYALTALRFWLSVDWHLHFNRELPILEVPPR